MLYLLQLFMFFIVAFYFPISLKILSDLSFLSAYWRKVRIFSSFKIDYIMKTACTYENAEFRRLNLFRIISNLFVMGRYCSFPVSCFTCFYYSQYDYNYDIEEGEQNRTWNYLLKVSAVARILKKDSGCSLHLIIMF